ncbi:hypothetical protein VI03_17525 [Burkholderia vietnamiensis]|uniref:hypothetical protein n=1 Tax=Burkholderia vietnamiensis TaxID=60552 RepID=UPI0006211EF3|nr:hypothetical protein [Burkholderia vietnamiensis]TPQ45420.1 hypothetical protein C2U71_12635 [Burkholderia ubonensis]KKI37589.1 hypothetical protein VI03_17525 [Burkholderia vietnamiensis]KVE52780.1 hypothetical protein WI94_19855 [Burkholderia vietnamiensis]KVE66351.1 hypothetical protein WI97_13410 [Burkholderia vietnamiensis]KVE86636.1 hypothetical protein WJ00_12335 [Burkholderia vietnamiensis]
MKPVMPSVSLAAAFALALALTACTTEPPSPLPPDVAGRSAPSTQTAQVTPPALGGDRDAHGCIGSAGYAWCAHTQQCERPWELAHAHGFANSAQAYEQFCGNGVAK